MNALRAGGPVAVRVIDLDEPLPALAGLAGYAGARIYVTWGGRLLGQVDLPTPTEEIAPARLRDRITAGLSSQLLAAMMERHPLADRPRPPLPARLPVSIIVATYDRPAYLRTCLEGLQAQETPRRVEILVVDNHPASGQTPPVVAEFSGIRLVREERTGLSYAR
ncbi:MAG: glycosyltransferase family 2 protein, partial [Anaerolineales bacterium]